MQQKQPLTKKLERYLKIKYTSILNLKHCPSAKTLKPRYHIGNVTTNGRTVEREADPHTHARFTFSQ